MDQAPLDPWIWNRNVLSYPATQPDTQADRNPQGYSLRDTKFWILVYRERRLGVGRCVLMPKFLDYAKDGDSDLFPKLWCLYTSIHGAIFLATDHHTPLSWSSCSRLASTALALAARTVLISLACLLPRDDMLNSKSACRNGFMPRECVKWEALLDRERALLIDGTGGQNCCLDTLWWTIFGKLCGPWNNAVFWGILFTANRKWYTVLCHFAPHCCFFFKGSNPEFKPGLVETQET